MKEKTIARTVWVVNEWYVWPVAWLLADRYVFGIEDLIRNVIVPTLENGRRLKRLRVLSHGNVRLEARKIVGVFIDMGGGDRLESRDFDEHGSPVSGTPTARFAEAVRSVMAPGSDLVFSACKQGHGTLLRDLSRCLGPDVRVRGYRDLGHPFGKGNISYRNGALE